MSNIIIPDIVESRMAREAKKAAEEYDPNLSFGWNQATNQWCVFLKKGTMQGSADYDLPILGFKTLPSHDEVKKRLYQTDAQRHGMEILENIRRKNEAAEKVREAISRDIDGQVAEAFEWGFRKMGSEKVRYAKTFMPGKGIKKNDISK